MRSPRTRSPSRLLVLLALLLVASFLLTCAKLRLLPPARPALRPAPMQTASLLTFVVLHHQQVTQALFPTLGRPLALRQVYLVLLPLVVVPLSLPRALSQALVLLLVIVPLNLNQRQLQLHHLPRAHGVRSLRRVHRQREAFLVP